MRLPVRHSLLASTLLIAPALHGTAHANEAETATNSDTIVVTAGLEQSSSATALALPVKETPQSVTIIDRKRIEDFAITNVNDLLEQAVGVNVERVETDRTYFSSRGFDVSNFQVDGIGLPLAWGIQFGDLDTALFENVEIVRGANAIMTGIGNPSATVNYVRKRPTDELKFTGSAQLGTRDYWRAEGDANIPLTDTLAVRAIYAHEDRDGYLSYNHVNRDVYGAILRWQATPSLRATVGYTRQENDADGVLWGAIPLVYTDGTRIDLKRSATTSADWTYWNTKDQSVFGELVYDFGGGWSATGIATYRRFQENAKLLYAYGYPDRETGEGVYGMAGIYPSDYKQYLGDVYVSGPFRLFGREHKLAFGVSVSKSDAKEYENFSEDTVVYPSPSEWGETGIPEPSYPGSYLAADYSDRLTRVYGAAHLSLTDRVKAVVGASAMWIKSTGFSYGADQARKDSKVSPYVGAVYELTPNVSFYASYTDIYNPQVEVGIDGARLDPAKGTSLEGGIKSTWLDGKLYATAAVFKAKQKGLAEYAGYFDEDGCPVGVDGVACNGKAGGSYYDPQDTTSTGFEVELSGQVTHNWTLSGGFTYLDIENADGDDTRTWIPTKSLNLASTYSVPELNDLKLGAQLRVQNATTAVVSDLSAYGGVEGDVTLKQKSYAILDLMAGVRVVEHVRASVNVRNVTNVKYLNSLKWGQAFYGAPRSAVVTLSVEY
ncbi:TonB-dependent siderophore receptor family protein [Novosphingobium resinovorum]|uniref:TonB-dependent siderophore receptor family protein n=1 Tax=Novosphingobium resinovorum TaxID=158500 RepID=A0A031JSQ7_9SPHN|nr:TonB-dependent siderophore receptor [Novosphingobium resinovorum]EZP80806.1 TonB-dependent siderophore receptor family protein [Novosphingobium resinovorum]